MNAISALCDVVPGWVWALIVAALLATGAAQQMHVATLKAQVHEQKALVANERAKFTGALLELSQAKAAAEKDARDREAGLQAAADKLREDKDAQINRLRADVRDLRYGLQYLPSRPSGIVIGKTPETSLTGEAGQVCPGPILYRETGEDLVSEAERADTIRIELIRLYDLYDRVREVIGK